MSVRTKAYFYALVLLPIVIFLIMLGWHAGGAALLHRYASGQLRWDRAALFSLVCLVLGTSVSIRLGRACIGFLRFRLAKMERSISRAEAPTLWQIVDDWVDTIGAPRIDRIILTPDFQAAARPTRRWFVGAREHALELGEPLLRVLTPEETECVIVHELAHMRHLDHRGRLMIAVTHTLLAIISPPVGQGRGAIGRVIQRVHGRFFADDIQQRRVHEQEADRVAARFAGAEPFARAMIRLELGATRMLWRMQDAMTREPESDSPEGAFRSFESRVSEPSPVDLQLLRMMLARPTLQDDTHPSLSDRLRAIGVNPDEASIPHPVAESESAAAVWLGDGPGLGAAREGRERTTEPSATAPEPAGTDPDVMKDLIDMVEARLDPSKHGSCLVLHRFLRRARDFARIRELFDRLVNDAKASADVLEWVFRHSLYGADASDASRAMLALSRLEGADPALHIRALRQLAERLAFDGRMAEARATWRLVVRLRTRPLDPETWRESSLVPEDLGTANLDRGTFTKITSTFIRDPRINGYWLASVHAEAPLQAPRVVLALSAQGSWWDRSNSLRRLRAALAAVPGCRIELVNFDACSRAVQDRLRILGMAQQRPE
jgi:Zn-dependent protease with chaperone function